jgi:hypothetical protein
MIDVALRRIYSTAADNASFLDACGLTNFDKYLYEEVGYPALHNMTAGLFCSPYAATSLREYFANGFEYYFVKNRQLVSKLSPQLYKLLIEVEKGLVEGKTYGTSSAESNDLLENLYQYRKDLTIGLLQGDRDAVWALLIKGLVETLDDIVDLTFDEDEE